MKATITRMFALGGACAVISCSTVSVTVDRDPSAPFHKYKTYALSPAAKGETLSPSSEAALRNTLRAGMAKKGYVEKSSGKPDLAIARHAFLRDKIAVHESIDRGYSRPGCWPYGYGYYTPWSGAPESYVDVTQYTQGTLILDFVDTRANQLVFRGKGTAVVGGPEENASKIREAVTRIVADLPSP